MASAPLSLRPARISQPRSRRWPAELDARLALRGALCLPYLGLAIWAAAHGVHSALDASLDRRAAAIRWSDGLSWIGRAYPPLPTLVAELPGGPAALGVAGALCAGGILHLAWEHLVRTGAPAWLTATVLVGLGGTPIFWFNATENLSGFVGLALFAVALAGLLDFTLSSRTTGGFVAGVSLAVAVLCDPSALLYTASAFLATPLLAWQRSRWAPGAIRSTATVVVFPTVALALAWAFLQWRYTGTLYHGGEIAPGFLQFPRGAFEQLRGSLVLVGRALAFSPFFLVSAALLLRRRPTGFLALLLVPLDVLLTRWLGLHAATGQGLVLLELAAILALPRRPSRPAALALALAAAAQVATWVVFLEPDGGVGTWMRAMGF